MIYWALFLIIFFIIIIIVIIFSIGNYLLRKIVESFLPKKEGFSNMDNSYLSKDECSQIDHMGDDKLFLQTGVNIPLGPIHYESYVGEIYTNEPKNGDNLTPKPNCSRTKFPFVQLPKCAFFYDGVWEPKMEKNDGYEYASYKLNPNTKNYEYYYSDKMLEHNFKIPDNFRDYSSTPYVEGGDKVQYFFNDSQQDVMDTELSCFANIFNAGITNELKKQENLQYPKTK